MKRLALAMGLVAAATFAAPLAAQSRSTGPWWDPANTGQRSTVDTRNGTIYNDGRVSSTRADGQWRRVGRDNNGNYVYVRTRYDSNGNLIQESARRDTWGRYRVFDRRVINSTSNRRTGRNGSVYGDRDNDRNNDGYEDRGNGRDRNDRWEQNGGHDNGRHNGWYKNKGRGHGRDD